MNRRHALTALLVLAAAPLGSAAQRRGAVARVAVLGVTTAAGYALQVDALRQGLRDLGYVEGRNVLIEYRWADDRPERLPALAAEVVRLRPDVIVTSGVATRSVKAATTTIPVVMAAGGDAVASGLVASLARPGGNLTGSTFFGPEISAKRLEILREAVPGVSRPAVLSNPDSRGGQASLEAMRSAAASLGVRLLEVAVRSPDGLDEAFAAMRRDHADGVIVLDDSILVAIARRIAGLCAAERLPGIGPAEFASGGGLLVYGVDFGALWRRAAAFVDRILKGASPATIPVERASRFVLAVNLKAAVALGLTIPEPLLLRADEVIR